MRGRDRGRQRPDELLTLLRQAGARILATVRGTPGLLLFSLLLGVALWVFVTEEENPTRTDIFPAPISVRAVNVGQSLAVANQLEFIDVRIAAPEDRWEQLTSDNFRAFVDLNGLEAREQNVPVRVEVQGISGVRVVETIPATVLVNLEGVLQKEVPVRTRSVGTLPLGYELEETVPETRVVTVSGPESLVELVQEAVADLNVTGLTVAVTQSVNLVPRGVGGGEIRGVRLEPPSMAVQIDIRQSILRRTIPLEVAVFGEPAPGYRVISVTVSPPTLSVRGDIGTLQQFDAIVLPGIDITGARENVLRDVTPALPAGTTTVGVRLVRVIVSIAAVDGSARISVAPQALGLPDGWTARFNVVAVEVSLQGPQPLLNALLADDVRVTIDVSGLSIGTHEVELSVELPDGLTATSVQPTPVSVTLTIS